MQRIGHSPTMLSIVKAMGQLGPHLSLETMAEGMETEAQRHILMGAG